MKQANILIVESDQASAAVVMDLLNLRGHKTITAVTSGAEAIAAAIEHKPDLMLVNISLSGPTDGLEAAGWIQSIHDVATVFLASAPGEVPAMELHALEPLNIIKSPVDKMELYQAVDRALRPDRIQPHVRGTRKSVEGWPDDQGLIVCRLSPDCTMTSVNTLCCEYLGRIENELIGRSVLDFVLPDDRNLIEDNLRSICIESPNCELELRLMGKHGNVWLRWIYQGTFDSAGNVTGFESYGWRPNSLGHGDKMPHVDPSQSSRVLEEMTADVLRANLVLREVLEARKKVELDLRLEHTKFQEIETILERSAALVYLTRNDDHMTVEYISGNVSQLGYSQEDFLTGRVRFKDIIHHDDVREASEIMSKAAKDGRGEFRHEHRIFTKSGEIRWIDHRTLLRRDLTGSVTHYEGVTLDITDRKRAEEALEQSEKRYRTLFNSVGDAVFVHTIDGTILDANMAAFEKLGFNRREFSCMTIQDMQAPNQEGMTDAHRIELTETGHTYFETVYVSKNGPSIPFEIHARTIQYGSPSVVLSVARDISERKKAEETLKKAHDELEQRVRERTEFNRRIIATSPVGISTYTADGRAGLINQAMAAILDESPTALAKQNFRELDWWKDSGLLKAANDVLAQGGAQRLEVHVETVVGKEAWFEARLSRFQSGGKPHLLLLADDITKRKKADQQIHKLTKALLNAQERERERISQNLHDQVAQDLSTLKIGFDTLFDGFRHIPPEMEEKRSIISKALNASIHAVRNLSYDLRPPGIERLGLVRIVFQFCEDFSAENQIETDFKSAGLEELQLDHDTTINLFRMLQEALNNVKKHADARHVKIRLIASFPNILIRIEDDGKGFDVQQRLLTALQEKRMGLASMQERVSALDGELTIQSSPNQGTKILIQVPFKEAGIGEPQENSSS